ncbi:ABC transporter ATP-binding protein [Candidatus Pyrohabitans sp.]
MSSVLLAREVSSGYNRLKIVDKVSLRVEDREIVVILGPNGSGKSTLLKTIFGLLSLMEGSITFLGRVLDTPKPHQLVKLGMAYVPQVDNIFPSLSVMENLEMGAYLSSDAEEAISRAFALFPELEDKASLTAINLSGGERQMLALARALMLEPKLLLLDEPSAGLAPTLVTRIMEKIKEIRESGVAVLLVEQNVKSALKIADRGYILAGGRKVFEGSAEEIMSHKDIGKIYFGRKR